MEFYEQSFEPRRRAPPSLFTATNASYQNEPTAQSTCIAASEGGLQTSNGSLTHGHHLLVSGNTASLAISNDGGGALTPSASATQRAPRRWALRLNAPAPNTAVASPCTSSSSSTYATVSAATGTNTHSGDPYPPKEQHRDGTAACLGIYTANISRGSSACDEKTKGTCASLSSKSHLSPCQTLWSGQSTAAAVQGNAFNECGTKPASFPMPTARNTMQDKEPPKPNPSPPGLNLVSRIVGNPLALGRITPNMSFTGGVNNNINSTCRPLFPIPLPTSVPLPVVDSAANTSTGKHFGTSGVERAVTASAAAEQNTWGSFSHTKPVIQGATSQLRAGALINKPLQQPPSVKVSANPLKNSDEPAATVSSHMPTSSAVRSGTVTASSPPPPQGTTNRVVARSAPRCLRKLGHKPTTLIIPSSLAPSSGSPSASAAIVGESTNKDSHAPLTNPATSTPNRTREERDAIHKLVLLLWESYRYQRQHLYNKHSASASSLASAASSCYGSGGSTPIARWSSRLKEGPGSLADSNLPSPPLFFNNSNNNHNRNTNFLHGSDGHKHATAHGNSVSVPPSSICSGAAATLPTEPLPVSRAVTLNASSPSSALAAANNNNNNINLFAESAREGRNAASTALLMTRGADDYFRSMYSTGNPLPPAGACDSTRTTTEAVFAVHGERERSANEAAPSCSLPLHASPTSAHAAIIKNAGDHEEPQGEAEERGNETLNRVNSTSTITAVRSDEIKTVNNSNNNNYALRGNASRGGLLGDGLSSVGQPTRSEAENEDEDASRMLSSGRGRNTESVYEPYHHHQHQQFAEVREPQTSRTTTTTNHLQTTIQLPLYEGDEIEMPPSPPNTENEVDDDEDTDISHRHTSFSISSAAGPALRVSPNPLIPLLSTTNSRRTLFTTNTNDEDNNNNTHNSSTSIEGFGIGVASEQRGVEGGISVGGTRGVSKQQQQQTRLLLAPGNWLSSPESLRRSQDLASPADSAPVFSTGSLLAPQPSSLSTQQFLFDQNASMGGEGRRPLDDGFTSLATVIGERSESISPEIDFLNPLPPVSAATAFVGNHASRKFNNNSSGVRRFSGMYADPANNDYESTPALRPSNLPTLLFSPMVPSQRQQLDANLRFSPQQLPPAPLPLLSSAAAPAAPSATSVSQHIALAHSQNVKAAPHKFDIKIASREDVKPNISAAHTAPISFISPSLNFVDLNTTSTTKGTTTTTTTTTVSSLPTEHEKTHAEKINDDTNNNKGGISNSTALQKTRNINNSTTSNSSTTTVSIPDIVMLSPSSASASAAAGTVHSEVKTQQKTKNLSSFDSLESYQGYYRMEEEQEEEEGVEKPNQHRYSVQRTPPLGRRGEGGVPAGVGLASVPSIRGASVDSIDLEDHAMLHHSVEALSSQWKSMLKQIGDVWDRLDGDVETKYHKLKVRITSNLVWDRDSRLETIPRSVVTPPLETIRQMNEEHERRIASLSKGQLFLEGSQSLSIPSSPSTTAPPTLGLGSADDISAHRVHSSLTKTKTKTTITRANNLSSPLSFES